MLIVFIYLKIIFDYLDKQLKKIETFFAFLNKITITFNIGAYLPRSCFSRYVLLWI